MSIPRFVTAATCFIVAVLLIPVAWSPGWNTADFLVVALLIVGCAVLVMTPPVVEDIPPDHPDALGSLDIREAEPTAHPNI